MSTVVVKLHDTGTLFTDTLMVDGIPVNLTGSSVRFLLRRGAAIISGGAIIVSPTAGTVEYQPIPGDIDTLGTYQQEWEVTDSSGNVLTFPNNSYNIVNIISDLG